MKIEHGTWIAILDGEKFLLLHNVGDTEFLNLEVVEIEENKNAAARELATDRPGRRHDSTQQTRQGVTTSGKSGMAQTDWHNVGEERFAEHIAETLGNWVAQGRLQKLVVVADPRTLGTLRQAYGDDLKAVIVAEIAKDFTNLPLDQIEKGISGYDDS